MQKERDENVRVILQTTSIIVQDELNGVTQKENSRAYYDCDTDDMGNVAQFIE